MNKTINKLINYLSEKRKTLFLIDNLGAISTAFFMFIIIQQLSEYFGMPKVVFTYLSAIATCFCIYSTICFIFIKGDATSFIRIIAIANLIYCALIIGLLTKYFPVLTLVEGIYFVIEIVFICGLSYIEISVATRGEEKRD